MAKYLIALDDGHGMSTAGKRTPKIPELGGRVIRENEFNRAVKRFLDVELKRCGFRTLIVSPTDEDVKLADRVKLANDKGADAYISIHYNAHTGKFETTNAEGHSIHVYPNAKNSRSLAECVMKYLVKGTKQKNRGIVENNFHVLRETKMPAILSENGFMDNKREALLMINVDFQKEVAREHAQGICDYFGVKYVPESEKKNTNYYRVQTGAFKNKQNAIDLEKELKKDGFKTYLIQSDGYYKVQVGAFEIKRNADGVANKLKTKGYSTYITTKSGNQVTVESDKPKKFKVVVKVDALNVRAGIGTKYKITGTIRDRGVYTITESKNGWGKLKSGLGWINLTYTTKL